MLELRIKDKNRNKDIRTRTTLTDVIGSILKLKWSWMRHIVRKAPEEWTY